MVTLRRPMLIPVVLLLGLSACKREDGLGSDALPPPSSLVDVLERALPEVTRPADRARVLLGIAEAEADRKVPSVQARLMAATVATRAVDLPSEQAGLRTRLVSVWCRVGGVKEARTVANEIGSVELAAEANVSLARALVDIKAFDEAEAVARAISVPRFRGPALLLLVQGMLRAGRRAQAGRLIAALDGLSERDEALAEVAGAYADAGDEALVHSALSDIQSPHWRGAAQASLALIHARAGHRKLAGWTVGEIESHWMRVRGYTNLYRHNYQAGRKKLAERYLAKAKALIDDIADPLMKSAATNEAVMSLAQTDRYAEAEALINTVPDEGVRRKAQAELVRRYAEVGRFDDSARILIQVEADALWGGEAATSLARAYAEAGRVDDALETLGHIRAPDLRLPAVGYVAGIQAEQRTPVGPGQARVIRGLLGLGP